MAFTFIVVMTPDAEADIRRIYNYILRKYKYRENARRYRRGILDTIDRLETYGGFLAISPYYSLQEAYGPDARTIVYKRITVIFNVTGDVIYIRRIIWGNTVV
ncbi:MAG: type II toxin-antitoxin system RelE/ParE family toxin [Tannerella sp.]|jgi:plasmid stabilization system protein ParE|nr:type II toxin-antitoxin system RelE/ParE family toxin [Tannerella sp.]